MCYQIRRYGQRSRGILAKSGFDIYSADGYYLYEIFWTRSDFSRDVVIQIVRRWAKQHSMEPKPLENDRCLCFEMYPGSIEIDQALRDMAKLLDLVATLIESTKGRLVFS